MPHFVLDQVIDLKSTAPQLIVLLPEASVRGISHGLTIFLQLGIRHHLLGLGGFNAFFVSAPVPWRFTTPLAGTGVSPQHSGVDTWSARLNRSKLFQCTNILMAGSPQADVALPMVAIAHGLNSSTSWLRRLAAISQHFSAISVVDRDARVFVKRFNGHPRLLMAIVKAAPFSDSVCPKGAGAHAAGLVRFHTPQCFVIHGYRPN